MIRKPVAIIANLYGFLATTAIGDFQVQQFGQQGFLQLVLDAVEVCLDLRFGTRLEFRFKAVAELVEFANLLWRQFRAVGHDSFSQIVRMTWSLRSTVRRTTPNRSAISAFV